MAEIDNETLREIERRLRRENARDPLLGKINEARRKAEANCSPGPAENAEPVREPGRQTIEQPATYRPARYLPYWPDYGGINRELLERENARRPR